ncbi:MAG: PDZ domain-containing protein, partial [Planctomycetes bacterium]|nr:PDZ domain-containing protein [Planctomycetota bacterium]
MERRYTILAIAVPPMLLAAFVLGFFLRGQAEGQEALGAKVRETARVIQERYYGEVADEKLEHAILDGMMNALDPYCQYFTKQEYEDFHSKAMSGNFFGVGIVVEEDRETGYVTVVTPLEDTPAFQADILPGDKMIKINGEDIKGQNLNDVVRKIKGEEGTKVTITLARRGREPFDVTLTRAQITIVAVKHKMLDERMGYVRISDFTEMLPQFDKAIADLRSKGMKGIVIDLRFNGGGLLDSAVELADRFLPKGKLIVSTKGRLRGDRREVMSEDGENDVIDVPVVILTNSGTASA